MKKTIITFILFIPLITFCQKIKLGPEVGLNINPTENSDIGQNYQLGYYFGGHLKYSFSEKFKTKS